MDHSMDNIPSTILSYFILHNFCEINGETVQDDLQNHAMQYDKDFQPPRDHNILYLQIKMLKVLKKVVN